MKLTEVVDFVFDGVNMQEMWVIIAQDFTQKIYPM